ncbi:hypothetical protein Rhein_0241 [Rheinheimera sp. A13L]|nr:hypothetical protein Rhein_0241 [Rheinheimera sp. A13L]
MSDPSPLTPEQRIKKLEQQLADTKQRAEFFEAVVEVLKRDERVAAAEYQVLEFVRAERMLQPRIGARKLQYLLQQHHHIQIGRDKLLDLLKDHRLLVSTQRAYHKTTQSHHRFRCHPNLLKTGPEKNHTNGTRAVVGCGYHLLTNSVWRSLSEFNYRCVVEENYGLSRP